LARQGQDLEERGEYDRAVALLAEALDLQEQVLGPLHLEHVSLLRSLAQAKQGQYQRGEEIQAEDEEDLPPDEEIPFWPGEEYDPGGEILALRQRVADIHEEALGPYHAVTLQALRELMSYYLMKNDQAAARAVGERIRQGMVDALGPDDPMVRLIQGTGRLPDDAGTQPD
jgi:tetratricopeptide (TPR) repeat protein